jgi:hypothetical protein
MCRGLVSLKAELESKIIAYLSAIIRDEVPGKTNQGCFLGPVIAAGDSPGPLWTAEVLMKYISKLAVHQGGADAQSIKR